MDSPLTDALPSSEARTSTEIAATFKMLFPCWKSYLAQTVRISGAVMFSVWIKTGGVVLIIVIGYIMKKTGTLKEAKGRAHASAKKEEKMW